MHHTAGMTTLDPSLLAQVTGGGMQDSFLNHVGMGKGVVEVPAGGHPPMTFAPVLIGRASHKDSLGWKNTLGHPWTVPWHQA